LNNIIVKKKTNKKKTDIEYKCFMGLFPEINRAWITIDKKLYIWDYINETDLYEYDELDQIILSVGLVKPKPGIFKEMIKYLIVLTTSVEIVLVDVSFQRKKEKETIDLCTSKKKKIKQSELQYING
jgi:nuclear pore complex protein Nup155